MKDLFGLYNRQQMQKDVYDMCVERRILDKTNELRFEKERSYVKQSMRSLGFIEAGQSVLSQFFN